MIPVISWDDPKLHFASHISATSLYTEGAGTTVQEVINFTKWVSKWPKLTKENRTRGQCDTGQGSGCSDTLWSRLNFWTRRWYYLLPSTMIDSTADGAVSSPAGEMLHSSVLEFIAFSLSDCVETCNVSTLQMMKKGKEACVSLCLSWVQHYSHYDVSAFLDMMVWSFSWSSQFHHNYNYELKQKYNKWVRTVFKVLFNFHTIILFCLVFNLYVLDSIIWENNNIQDLCNDPVSSWGSINFNPIIILWLYIIISSMSGLLCHLNLVYPSIFFNGNLLRRREVHTHHKTTEWVTRDKLSWHSLALTVKTNILCIYPIKNHIMESQCDSGAFCRAQEMSEIHVHHWLSLRWSCQLCGLMYRHGRRGFFGNACV